MIVRPLRWLVALLLGVLLGTVMADSTVSAPAAASTLTGYTYDGVLASASRYEGVTERGPPAEYDLVAAHHAVDRGSYGASALPDVALGHRYTTYVQAKLLAQATSTIGTTRRPGWATDASTSSLAPVQVAAKTRVYRSGGSGGTGGGISLDEAAAAASRN